MKLSISSSLWLVPLLAVFNGVNGEDYLVSRSLSHSGHSKRGVAAAPFNLTIYHVNDIHAHIDEIKTAGVDCADPSQGCYGGYARIKGVIDAKRPLSNNSLFLNLGDEFQGTMFYNYYKGEKIAETINQLGFDAMTLGNHEFDAGEEYLGAFLKNVTFPVVCANIDTKEPNINSTVKPYKVFTQYKTAVIAVTTDTIPTSSNPSKDTKFADPVSTAQFWADYVYANEKDVERIVLMTHIGYAEDIELARRTKGIHVIVGSHSHTLLGDMEDAAGKYPTIETNLDGEEVFVVTAWRYGVYLGYLDVQFDGRRAVSYTGGPILLDNRTEQDTELAKEIKAWRGPFEEFSKVVIGTTEVNLDAECWGQECTLGDLMCDAMIDSRAGKSQIDGCFINSGSVRVPIGVGNVTRGHVLTSFPFGSALTELKFTGSDLWKTFEGILSGVSQFPEYNGKTIISFIEVGGMRVTYNPNNEVGKRLINLEIGAGEGLKKVDLAKEYNIVTNDFCAGGGDSLFPAVEEFTLLETMDEILTTYIEKTSVIQAVQGGRYVQTNDTNPVTASNGAPKPWSISPTCLLALVSILRYV